MALNRQQIQQNIDALTEQGADKNTIQEYVTSVGKATPSSIEPTSKPKKDFLGKAAGAFDTVFGGGKVGELIGGLAAKSGLTGLSKEERQFVDLPSAKEVGGSAARAGLLFTPMGRGAQAIGAGAKALGAGAKLATDAGRIGVGAGTGFGFDVASGLEQGQDVSEAIKPGVGTAVGGGLPVLGALGRGVASNLATKIPKRFASSALKLTPKEAASKSGQKAVETLLSGRVGSKSKLLSQSQDNLTSLNEKIASSLRATPVARIGKTEIAKQIQLNKFFKDAGLSVNEVIDEIIARVPRARTLLLKKNLTLTEANRLRQIIDQTIGDPFFTAQNPGFSKELLNAFARTLSDTVKRKAPSGTRNLFTDLSNEISLFKQLEKSAQRGSGNQILSFGDLIGGGLGTAAAGPLGTLPGIALRRGLQSTPFLTGAAQLSQGIGRTLKKTPPALSNLSKPFLGLMNRQSSQ